MFLTSRSEKRKIPTIRVHACCASTRSDARITQLVRRKGYGARNAPSDARTMNADGP